MGISVNRPKIVYISNNNDLKFHKFCLIISLLIQVVFVLNFLGITKVSVISA